MIIREFVQDPSHPALLLALKMHELLGKLEKAVDYKIFNIYKLYFLYIYFYCHQ